jgi:hypothetical protein
MTRPSPVFGTVINSRDYCSQQEMVGKTRTFRRKRKSYARTDLEEVAASSARKLQSFNKIGNSKKLPELLTDLFSCQNNYSCPLGGL